MIRPCLAGGFSIWYFDQNGYYERINEEIGGCRIKQTIDSGDYGNDKVISNYYYGYLDSLNISSGSIVPLRSSISTYYSHLFEQLEPNAPMVKEIHNYIYNLSSSSLYSLFSKDGNHILYDNVFVGKGVNNESGLTRYKYNAHAYDADPMVIYDEQIPGTPLTNNFVSGELLEKINYSKQVDGFVKKNKTIYNYSFNEGYGGSAKYFNTSQSQKLLLVMYYNLNTYFINHKWRVLASEDYFEYDGSGNEIKSIHTDYEYSNPNHYQLTNRSVKTSKGIQKDNNYFYPKDFNETVENFQILSENNIINKPVKTNVLIENKIVNSKIAKYNNFGQIIELFSFENSGLISEPIHNPNQVTTIPQYYSAIANLLYDSESNTVKQIDYRNKPSTTILWGYNYSYVIAIIENAIYSEIESLLPSSYSELQTKSNEELNTIFNTIRDTNPQFNITNYTYQPLVGILSITDINGKKTEYDYDSLNRLQLIKDVDDDWIRILKKLEYNYLDL